MVLKLLFWGGKLLQFLRVWLLESQTGQTRSCDTVSDTLSKNQILSKNDHICPSVTLFFFPAQIPNLFYGDEQSDCPLPCTTISTETRLSYQQVGLAPGAIMVSFDHTVEVRFDKKGILVSFLPGFIIHLFALSR